MPSPGSPKKCMPTQDPARMFTPETSSTRKSVVLPLRTRTMNPIVQLENLKRSPINCHSSISTAGEKFGV
jgi:hypothetical protein